MKCDVQACSEEITKHKQFKNNKRNNNNNNGNDKDVYKRQLLDCVDSFGGGNQYTENYTELSLTLVFSDRHE